ncbi:PAS domain S-box protein [bacterium]|nr:PAS domain S-box protein [bacterium]
MPITRYPQPVDPSGSQPSPNPGTELPPDPVFLRLLTEQMPCAVWTTDATPAFTSNYGSALAALDFRPGEANGTALADFFPPDHPAHAAHRRALAGEAVRYEAEYRGRAFDCRVEPLRGADGNVTGCVGVALDVTEQRAAERRHARDAMLLANVHDSVVVTDLDGVVTYWNDGATRLFGWTAGEMLGRRYADRYVEPVRTWVADQIWARGAGGDWDGEFEDYRKDGSRVWVDARVRRMTDADGRPVGVIGVCHDITARKRAEDELWRTADLLRAVADTTTDAMFVKDRDGKYLFMNEAAARFVGRPVAEVLGRDDTAVFDPDSARLLMARDRRVMAAGRTETEEEELTAAGTTRVFLATKGPYRDAAGAVVGLIGVSRDVTDRVRAERALREKEQSLRESEARYRAIVEATPECVKLIAPDGTLLQMNPAGLRMVEADGAAAVLGACVYDLVAPEHRTAFRAFNEQVCRGEGGALAFDIIGLRGTRRQMETMAVPLPTPGGGCNHLAVTRDVTARRRAEDALHLRDRAIQAVTQGIVLTDPNLPDNPVVYASPGFEHVTGYPASEVVGRNCRFLHGPDTDPAELARLRAAIRAGEACTVELLNYRKDGTPFWNELSVSPVRDGAGALTHFVGVQVDVTGRKTLEEHLRQAQKMEAVGRLAGGVAHDFNNLLTVITGFAELLHGMLDDRPDARPLVEEIGKAGRRAAGLTRQLLAFSRKQVLQPKLIDPNALLADLGRMLRPLLGEDIELALTLAPAVRRVRVDPGQLEQVVMNLAVNARDAMPTGGRLTVETGNATLDEAYAEFRPEVRPGNYVRLAVTDTGAGMDRAVADRVFEPFFTTKGEGRGTGLGLATVYGIIKQSGGHIEVTSEVGTGTTFEVYLPAADEAPGSRVGVALPDRAPGGRETVLLVEDEEAVRELAARVLRTKGYHVVEAADGAAALATAARHPGPIDLLVTDVVMPRLGGRELAARLAETRPGLRVLYLSGYTDDAVVRHGVTEAQVAFLQKPFGPDALAGKVREVLDAGR